jgi:serine/threonine protein kinase
MDILRIQALFDEVCDLSPSQRLEELRKRKATPEEIQEVLVYCEADAKAAQNELFENGIIQLKRISMIGQEIGGYKIIGEIEGGGMGEVYLAESVNPNIPQARHRAIIKIVGTNLAKEEWRRFDAEREILASLKHQNIAQYYDGGRLDDGRPFMIMEYVEGKSLREVMFERRSRSFSPQEILILTQQACAGIGAAHTKGVIHRDIKPENLIISETPDGLTVTVIDFGIAIPKDLALQLTIKKTKRYEGHPGIGTAAYMSPEQANAVSRDDMDLRTDVYSFGVLLYELFVGKRPFSGEPDELVQHHIHTPAPPPSVSPTIDQVILKSLAKKPQDRQQSMLELAAELEKALQPAPIVAESVSPKKQKRWLAWVGGGSVAAAVLAAGVWAFSGLPSSFLSTPAASSSPVVVSPSSVPTTLNGSERTADNSTPGATTTGTPNGASNAAPTPTPATTAATNSLTVSLWQANKKTGEPVAVTTAKPFHAGDSLRIGVKAAQSGFLYVVQKQSDGTVVFGRPGVRPVTAGQTLTIPPDKQMWLTLDNRKGEETVYLLFARERNDPLLADIEQAIARKQESLPAATLTKLAAATTAVSGGDTVTHAGALAAMLKIRHE